MNNLRSALDVETPHPLLGFPIRVADASMLAHVFHPQIQHEGLDETTRLRHVFEYPPVEGPVAPTLVAELAQRYQEGRAIRSRIRYSTVTRTGPRCSSTSCTSMGSGQCMEGVRSSAAPF